MPVLVEALSVIIKDSSIRTKYIGGLDKFLETIPNGTYCNDGILHRIGFMTPEDNKQYIRLLEQNGLTFILSNEFVDIAVVDMLTGPTLKCPWIGFSRRNFFKNHTHLRNSNEFFSIAWFHDGKHGYGIPVNQNFKINIAFPQGWSPDHAILGNNFIQSEDVVHGLIELSYENGVTKYWYSETGNIVDIGRPKIEGESNTDSN